MIEINLDAKNPEQHILKEYLEKNASDVLIDKINNGVIIEKSGKTLVNKKDFDTFLNYANEEAHKLAEKGARFACIKSDTVFSWMMHYFEEDSIEGVLYNSDGTEYKPPRPIIHTKNTTKPTASTPIIPKPQMSLFDLMGEPEKPVEQPIETDTEDVEDDGFTDEEIREALEELEEENNLKVDAETGEIIHEFEEPEPKEDSSVDEVLQKLLDIFGNQITVR